MSKHGPAKAPCRSCPYRRDVPSGVWAKEEYEKLPGYDGTTGQQLEAGAMGAFFCHQQTGRLCAGWVGCHDMNESLGLRLASMHGSISERDVDAAFDYVSPVPLFDSGAEAAAHGLAQLEEPGEQARRTIDRLERKRPRR
jgi:Family of unknown function (DUF6283)